MMREKLTDSEIQEEFSRLAETAGDGLDCPSPETIWKSGRGELEPDQNEPVVIHLGDCTACATAWRIARDLDSDKKVVSISDGKGRFSTRRWLPMLAAAAVIICAVGLSVHFWQPALDDSVVLRTQETDWLKSVMDKSVPLPRGSAKLLWTAGPEGTIYDVMVSDEAGEILSRGYDLRDTAYEIPVESLDGVDTGGKILWQVTARVPDGRVLHSETFIATIEE